MATPLSDLLRAVLFDAGAQEQFRMAPETYLRSAGYSELDAADVREAILVLGEGSPPAEASQFLAAGQAIGGDPAAVDGIDGIDVLAPGLTGAGDGLVAAVEAVDAHDAFTAADAGDAQRVIEFAGDPEPTSTDAFGAGSDHDSDPFAADESAGDFGSGDATGSGERADDDDEAFEAAASPPEAADPSELDDPAELDELPALRNAEPDDHRYTEDHDPQLDDPSDDWDLLGE